MSSPEGRPKNGRYNIGLIALIVVLLAMAAFIVVKKRASSVANANINYDDPNMQKTNEFVNEATASCMQKEVDASSDLPSCINNYKGGPTTDSKAKNSSEKEPDSTPDSEPVDLSTSPATSPVTSPASSN